MEEGACSNVIFIVSSHFRDVAIYIKTILFSLIEVIFKVMRFMPFTLNSNKSIIFQFFNYFSLRPY